MQRKHVSTRRVVVPIALTLLTLSVHPATAQALLYTLNGVTFNDGGTATGTFIYDSRSTTLVSYDITTTDGLTDTIIGFHYTTANSSGIGRAPYSFTFNAASPNPRHLLGLDLSRTVGATPGNYSIYPGTLTPDGGLSNSGELTDPNNPVPADRAVVSGSVVVTPAPEPSQTAALGLGILALAGLTLKARKRKATDA